jgi:hypothetical protein
MPKEKRKRKKKRKRVQRRNNKTHGECIIST